MFSSDDLLADIDAVNIGKILLSSNRRLHEVVKEYYSFLYLTRYSSFLTNRFFGDLKLVKSQSELCI